MTRSCGALGLVALHGATITHPPVRRHTHRADGFDAAGAPLIER